MVGIFAGLAIRPTSRRTYQSALRFYADYCVATGRSWWLAIDETNLCSAMVWFCSRRSVKTLSSYLSALQYWHDSCSFGPLPKGILFRRTRKGLENVYSQFDHVRPAHAITLADIARILPLLDLRSFVDARNWCCLLFGFYGLLRVGEYTGTVSKPAKLSVKHVVIDPTGIQLTIPWSKTDVTAATVRFCSRADILDPYAAARHYSSFFTSPRRATDPFFAADRTGEAPLTAQSFATWLKFRCATIGLDHKKISGHSLRRGGCTALFMAGCSETVIAQHGRWRSDCYRRYFDVKTPHYLATEQLRDNSNGRYPSLPNNNLSFSSL